MNLLDQKLKEKLLLFSNIDNDTQSNDRLIQTTSAKQQQLRGYNKTENHPTNASTKQYDLLYSNFFDNTSYQPGFNRLGIPKTRKATKTSRPRTPSEYTTIQSNKQRSKSKSQSPSYTTGDRLYNYGFYIKNKINQQRKREDIILQQQMTPKMLLTSRRLSHSNSSVEIANKQKKKGGYEEKISYTPKLNQKSLKIAQHLEPSSVRLTTIKKRQRSIDLLENKRNISTSSTAKRSKRIDELYTKGIETMHKRSKVYRENKRLNEYEYQKYSFKPNIIVNSPVLNNNIHKNENYNISNKDKDDTYLKQCDWKKKINNQNQKKKDKKENEVMKQCTFKPDIQQIDIKNDEKFILNHADQINQYVSKRRDVIQKNKDYEEYKSKRLGIINNNPLRPTTTKEFKFQTESRSHSRERKTKRNNNSLIYLKKQIQNKTTVYNNNTNINTDQSVMFINAINALHSKIENLNI